MSTDPQQLLADAQRVDLATACPDEFTSITNRIQQTTLQMLRIDTAAQWVAAVQQHGSERDALAAARAERQRLERGMATFELALAVGRPEITAQSPIKVTGWKEEIDGEDWLVKEVTHTLNESNGWSSKVQMERGGATEAKE